MLTHSAERSIHVLNRTGKRHKKHKEIPGLSDMRAFFSDEGNKIFNCRNLVMTLQIAHVYGVLQADICQVQPLQPEVVQAVHIRHKGESSGWNARFASL